MHFVMAIALRIVNFRLHLLCFLLPEIKYFIYFQHLESCEKDI